jgi:hypothetical protein
MKRAVFSICLALLGLAGARAQPGMHVRAVNPQENAYSYYNWTPPPRPRTTPAVPVPPPGSSFVPQVPVLTEPHPQRKGFRRGGGRQYSLGFGPRRFHGGRRHHGGHHRRR